MEQIERNLSELEQMSARTEARLAAIPHSHSRVSKRCLVLVNEPGRLEDALKWIKSHQIQVESLALIQKFPELATPVVLKPTHDTIIPPFLKTLTSATETTTEKVVIYAVPPLELTATAVNLLHSDIDLVIVVGCHCLSRKEYEDVQEFKPLVEEIILKEAIQPVILFK